MKLPADSHFHILLLFRVGGELFGILFSTIMLAVALYYYVSTSNFLKKAAITEGTVGKMHQTYNKNRLRTSNQFAIQFVTRDGKKIVTKPHVLSSNPPRYHTGQKVEILYLPEQPHDAKINDFFSLWGITALIGGIGGGIFLLSGGIILMRAREMKTFIDQYPAERRRQLLPVHPQRRLFTDTVTEGKSVDTENLRLSQQRPPAQSNPTHTAQAPQGIHRKRDSREIRD